MAQPTPAPMKTGNKAAGARTGAPAGSRVGAKMGASHGKAMSGMGNTPSVKAGGPGPNVHHTPGGTVKAGR